MFSSDQRLTWLSIASLYFRVLDTEVEQRCLGNVIREGGAFAPAPLARCCSWHYSFLIVHLGEPLILEEHRGCLMIRKHLTFWSIAFLALSYAFAPGDSNLFLRSWKDTYKGTRKVDEETSTKSWNLHVPSIDIPHIIFLCSASPILHNFQIEVLWQPCAKQFYGCHFSTGSAGSYPLKPCRMPWSWSSVQFSRSVVSNSLWPHGLYVVWQAPLSMGFLRQEHWSGLPFPSPGDLLDPGIKTVSSALAGGFSTAEPPGKPLKCIWLTKDNRVIS